MGSILSKCKKLKKLYRLALDYWQLGRLALAYGGWIGFIINSHPWGEVIDYIKIVGQAVLWSWREEPQGAGTFDCSWNIEDLAPAPG